jgi:hypothetical protein
VGKRPAGEEVTWLDEGLLTIRAPSKAPAIVPKLALPQMKQ